MSTKLYNASGDTILVHQSKVDYLVTRGWSRTPPRKPKSRPSKTRSTDEIEHEHTDNEGL